MGIWMFVMFILLFPTSFNMFDLLKRKEDISEKASIALVQ